MSRESGAILQKILQKLEKLDIIQSSLGKIESQLANLEMQTQELEIVQGTAKKEKFKKNLTSPPHLFNIASAHPMQ